MHVLAFVSIFLKEKESIRERQCPLWNKIKNHLEFHHKYLEAKSHPFLIRILA